MLSSQRNQLGVKSSVSNRETLGAHCISMRESPDSSCPLEKTATNSPVTGQFQLPGLHICLYVIYSVRVIRLIYDEMHINLILLLLCKYTLSVTVYMNNAVYSALASTSKTFPFYLK